MVLRRWDVVFMEPRAIVVRRVRAVDVERVELEVGVGGARAVDTRGVHEVKP